MFIVLALLLASVLAIAALIGVRILGSGVSGLVQQPATPVVVDDA